jgi:valyl-tRNA synthetase
MYQGTHPVNWCPHDETAIADAEVDYVKRESALHYIRFPLEASDEYLLIATSRPEFIPACVAIEVNPQDERYAKFIGRKAVVPIVNRTVTVIPEESVDPKFGTGVVQICTYGTRRRHNRPQTKLPSSTSYQKRQISEGRQKYAGSH